MINSTKHQTETYEFAFVNPTWQLGCRHIAREHTDETSNGNNQSKIQKDLRRPRTLKDPS